MRQHHWMAGCLGLLAAAAALAEPLTYGSWTIDVTDDRSGMYVATVNDSGSVLAQSCDFGDESCAWIIALATACEEDANYPVLVNASTGAVSLTAICTGQSASGKTYRYMLSPFEDIDRILKSADSVGFAFPMQGDQIKVVRFSMTGASRAITKMRELAEKRVNSKPQSPGMRDETL